MNNTNFYKTVNGATGSFIFNIIVIVLFIVISSTYSEKQQNSSTNSSSPNYSSEPKKIENGERPTSYTESYTLKEGATPIRIIIPDGYKVDYYGGGKKYYHQAQNSPKEIWGGGSCPTGLGNPNAVYADISYYNEEITVMCKFTKIK